MILIDETTSLLGVCTRHGRQFHDTNSNYVLPNDEEEHKRLSYQHEAIKIMVGGNYVAPLPRLNAGTSPQSMLDVCSGSGQWVFEIAQEFPFAKVVGIDLSKPTLGQSVIALAHVLTIIDLICAGSLQSPQQIRHL
ncbi:hypothetical protein FS749_008853 [Ceratobasidium sp. UAMH 11750]|nr:hypothetical protein FS749_008853 [Ceratobasidium sp. UAMH 11750]